MKLSGLSRSGPGVSVFGYLPAPALIPKRHLFGVVVRVVVVFAPACSSYSGLFGCFVLYHARHAAHQNQRRSLMRAPEPPILEHGVNRLRIHVQQHCQYPKFCSLLHLPIPFPYAVRMVPLTVYAVRSSALNSMSLSMSGKNLL